MFVGGGGDVWWVTCLFVQGEFAQGDLHAKTTIVGHHGVTKIQTRLDYGFRV
jgi:hypothetical protein